MILKEAWEQRAKLWTEGEYLHTKGYVTKAIKLWSKGDRIYLDAVVGFFGPNAIIDWQTGNVDAKPLPIPACELGL